MIKVPQTSIGLSQIRHTLSCYKLSRVVIQIKKMLDVF